MCGVSIIIPTLNEVDYLERTIRHLSILQPPAQEIVVVDGGSDDGTVSLADKLASLTQTPIKIIASPIRGRAAQMNRGAKEATGEILCFLHADTLVPDDLVEAIASTLANPNIAGGGFISLMSNSRQVRWGISCHNYIKSFYAPLLFRPHLFFRGLRLLFGDQVIFCRRRDFWQYGGFDPRISIMEEADLCFKLVRCGRICLVNRVVFSSDRRVARWGSLKATLIYLYIGFCWGLGISPDYLKRLYPDIRDRRADLDHHRDIKNPICR